MKCYCGSEQSFNLCCGAIIEDRAIANTPEQLMRSRYSAYAIADANYIFNTYALSTKQSQSLEDIQQWAKHTKWLKLEVHSSDDISLEDIIVTESTLPAKVHFTATYIADKKFHRMSEHSNFIVEQQRWRYLDGEVTEHLELTSPKRNEPCICGSNKKFKRCCATKL